MASKFARSDKLRKKLLIGLTVALVLLACIVAPASAESGKCGDNLTWNWSGDYTYALTISGTGDMYNYSEDNPAPWRDLLNNNSTCFSITIEDGITSIGDYAFECDADYGGCMTLTVPSSVTKIGTHAFDGMRDAYNCLNLNISANCVLSDNALYNAPFKNVTADLSNPHYTSEGGSLYNKDKSELIYFSFTESSWGTFTIPSTVVKIGENVFKGRNIMGLNIGENLTDINDKTFNGLNYLQSFTVDSNNPVLSSADGILFNKDQTVLIKYPHNKHATSYTYAIPEGVSVISPYSFADSCLNETLYQSFSYLYNVTIPSSVTNLEDAFANELGTTHFKFTVADGNLIYSSDNMGSLYNKIENSLIVMGRDAYQTSAVIPESVLIIGKYACAKSTGMTGITLPEGLECICEGAFLGAFNDNSDVNIVIPDSVTEIGEYAFSGCNFDTLTLGNGITTVPSHLLQLSSSSSRTLILSDSINEIPDDSFEFENSSYGIPFSIDVPSTNPYFIVENHVVYDAGKTILYLVNFDFSIYGYTLHLPDTIQTIKSYAFKTGGCSYIYLPNSMTIITESMFEGVPVANIFLPDTLVEIQDNAFKDCKNLTSFSIPNSVTTIGDNIISGCYNIGTLYLGKNVSDLKSLGIYDITYLSSVEVDSENPYYQSIGGAVYSKGSDENGKVDLIFVPCGLSCYGTFIVPSNVKSIKTDAMNNFYYISTVIIPATVEVLEDDFVDFYGAYGDTLNLVFDDYNGSNLTYIGENTFKSVSSGTFALPELTNIPEGKIVDGWYENGTTKVEGDITVPNTNFYELKFKDIIAEVYDENGDLVKGDCTSLNDINTTLGSNEGYTVKFLTDATFTESDLTGGQWNCNNNTTFTTDNDVTITLKVSDGGVSPSNIRIDVGTKGATFENLKFKIESPSGGFSSLNIVSGCVFDNCEIESNKTIYVNGDNESDVLNVEFNDCKIRVTDDDAVKLSSLNYETTEDVVKFDGCEVTATKEGKYAILSTESSGKETGTDFDVTIDDCTVKGVAGSIGCTSVVNPFTGIISSGKFSDDIALQGYVASGYSTELNGEWYDVVLSGECVAEVWDSNGVVASFSTLQNALNSVDSSSKYIKIVADFDCAGDIDFDKNFNLKITSDTQRTINVNNNWTVSGTATFENLNLNFAGDGVYITDDDSDYASNVKFDNCSLTVTDGEFAIYDDSYHKKLIVENTKVKSSDLGVVVDNSGSDEDFSDGIGKNVNITGNSQIQTDGVALSVSGYVNVNAESSKFIATHDSSITLNGLNSGSEMSIVGCTVGDSNMDSSLYAISYSSNECDTVFNIQNSTLYAGGANVMYVGGDGDLTLENVEISSGNANAIVIENMGEDGSVILNNCKIASYGNCVKESWSIPALSGTPNIILDDCKMYSNETLNLQHGDGIVTNGLYRTIDDKYIAESYYKVWDEDESAYRITNEVYTVTYTFNGQQYETVENHNAGENVTVKAKPVVEGHDVTDWSSNDVTITEGTFVMPSSAVTITATSTPRVHTVTYKLDGQIYGDVDNVSYDTEVVLREKPVVAGHTVSDWASSDVTISGGSFMMPDNDVVITATSDRENYTVTIQSNDNSYGTVDKTSVIAPYGTELHTSNNVLTVGSTIIIATPNENTEQYIYTFNEWSGVTSTVAGNMSVTANFSRYTNDYSVTFHANDGSGLTSEQEFAYGIEQNLNENTFVRAGYSFGGWAITSNGNPVYVDKQRIAITEDIDLYAYWIYGGGQGTKIPTEAGVPVEVEDDYGNIVSVTFTDTPSDNMILVFRDETEESVPELQGNVIRLPYDISLYKNGELYHELGADIEFTVLKSSVENADNVKLAHYVNGTWTYIDVVLIGEDDNSYKFRAHVDSFSPFSIIEEKSVTPVNRSSSSVTSFKGEQNGNVFTFDNAVVIKKAVLPNATYARVVNGSGSDWYVCNLNTDLNGIGTIYFQIPLDVISIKKGTVNNVSVYAGSVECPIKYLTSEGGYAKYVANITSGGKICINIDPNYTSSNIATEIGEQSNSIKETVSEIKETVNEVKETVVETKPVATPKTTKNTTSPAPIAGLIGGFGIAGWLLLRRRH